MTDAEGPSRRDGDSERRDVLNESASQLPKAKDLP